MGLDQCTQFEDQECEEARVAKAEDVEIAVLHLLTRSEEADRILLKINRPLATLSDSRMAYINRTQPVVQVLLQALEHQTPLETEAMTEFEEALYAWSQTQHHGTLHQAIVKTRDWLNAQSVTDIGAKAEHICLWGRQQNVDAMFRRLLVTTMHRSSKAFVDQQAIDEMDSIWSVLHDHTQPH